MKHRPYTQRTVLLLLLFWVAFIWGHSMIPAAGSSQESRRVGQLLAPLLELFVGEGNVTDHLVRKLAHFAEYAMLGALIGSVLLARKRTSFFHWSYGLLCALAVAVLDESIQLFVDGRGAQVTDILLDTGGSLTGLLLIWAVSGLARRRR